MSPHLRVISADHALRHRARTILTGLAAVFMRCSLVLMGGENGQAVGAELLIASFALAVAGMLSFRQVARSGAQVPRASVLRTLGGTACYSAEMIGAAVLIAGGRTCARSSRAPLSSSSSRP